MKFTFNSKYIYILNTRTSVAKFKLLIFLVTTHVRKYTTVYSEKLILFLILHVSP